MVGLGSKSSATSWDSLAREHGIGSTGFSFGTQMCWFVSTKRFLSYTMILMVSGVMDNFGSILVGSFDANCCC
jgi:hypothetical protein